MNYLRRLAGIIGIMIAAILICATLVYGVALYAWAMDVYGIWGFLGGLLVIAMIVAIFD